MNKSEIISATLDQLLLEEGNDFVADEQGIISAAEEGSMAKTGIAIKILSVFGGVAASLTFLGFLLLAGLYESQTGMTILGILFIGASVILNKIVKSVVLESVTVSFYIVGFCLLGFGLGSNNIRIEIVCIVLIIASAVSMAINQSYLLSFLSVLIINGSVLSIMILNDAMNLFHLFGAVQVIIVVWIFLNEAAVLKVGSTVSKLYNPVRTGMMVSLLTTLAVPWFASLFSFPLYSPWWLSAVIIVAVLYLSYKLSIVFSLTDFNDKMLLYTIAAIMFLPHIMSPAIPGSLLVVLLGFYVRHRGAVILGLIYFLYVLSRYYYELSFTLLTKSVYLFGAGLLFIMVFVVINKKFNNSEKV
ncbi:MAG: DUF4401 domain-containing protein [Chitinophagaceae bacterium]|nr:MAG: DUF4401 domain-containing protein [Chitinophagaceae bacterium]